MAASALEIEDLVKYFPVPQTGVRAFLNPFSPLTHPALLGVSFQVGPGEIAALIGANGSGKSTLLRILATLLVPTRGSARVSSYDVERQGPLVRTQLGFHSATDGGFYDRLTARENLQFFAAMNNLFDTEVPMPTASRACPSHRDHRISRILLRQHESGPGGSQWRDQLHRAPAVEGGLATPTGLRCG